MSNKTRTTRASVTAAPCLAWVGRYVLRDLCGLGGGGGCAWRTPCGGRCLLQQNPVCAAPLRAALGAGEGSQGSVTGTALAVLLCRPLLCPGPARGRLSNSPASASLSFQRKTAWAEASVPPAATPELLISQLLCSTWERNTQKI